MNHHFYLGGGGFGGGCHDCQEIEREPKILGMFASIVLGVNKSKVIKLYNRLVKLWGFRNDA